MLELTTYTAADEKSLDTAGGEASRMKASIRVNPLYMQAIAAIQQAGIERIKQNVRAGIIRNQQQAARISEQLRQNAAEISDIQKSMYESTSAMQDRVTQLTAQRGHTGREPLREQRRYGGGHPHRQRHAGMEYLGCGYYPLVGQLLLQSQH